MVSAVMNTQGEAPGLVSATALPQTQAPLKIRSKPAPWWQGDTLEESVLKRS